MLMLRREEEDQAPRVTHARLCIKDEGGSGISWRHLRRSSSSSSNSSSSSINPMREAIEACCWWRGVVCGNGHGKVALKT